MRFVWASAHAPSQYFPVPLRPSGWAGPLFCWFNVLTLTLLSLNIIIFLVSLNTCLHLKMKKGKKKNARYGACTSVLEDGYDVDDGLVPSGSEDKGCSTAK